LHQAEVTTLKNSQVQLLATKDEHIARLNEELQRVRSSANPPDALGDLARVGKVVSAVKEFVPGFGGGSQAPAPDSNTWDMLLDHAKPIIEQVANNLAPRPVVTIAPPPPAPAPAAPTAPLRTQASVTRRRPIDLRRIEVPIDPRIGNLPIDPRMADIPIDPRMADIPIDPRMADIPIDPRMADAMRAPRDFWRRAQTPRRDLTSRPRPAPAAPITAPEARPPAVPVATPETAPAQTAAAPAATIVEGLGYLESAFRDGKPVAEVARESVRLFPAGILRTLVTGGPDLVVGEVEKRSPSSVLTSPGGRRYVRELIEALRADLDAAS
jgi:hypothetical protein